MPLPNIALITGGNSVSNGPVIDVSRFEAMLIDVDFTGVASIQAYIAGPLGLFVQVPMWNYGTTTYIGAQNNLVSGDGIYLVPVSGIDSLQIRITAYTSGIVTVKGRGLVDAPVFPSIIMAHAYDADTGAVSTTRPEIIADMRGFNGSNTVRMRIPAQIIPVAGIAYTAGTPQTIWTPAAGKRFRLLGWALSLSVAGSIIFKYGAAGTEFLRTPTVLIGDHDTSPWLGLGVMPGAVLDPLKLDVTANGTVAGYVFGTEE